MSNKQKARKRPKRRRPARSPATPNSTDSTYLNALSLHRAGNLNEARRLYCDVLAGDPNHVDSWHMMGMLLVQANQSAAGLECLVKAMSITPMDTELMVNLGAVYLSLNMLEEADQWLTKAVQRRPSNANAQNNLGSLWLEKRQPETAEKYFRLALALEPDHVDAINNLGNALQQQGRLVEASTVYNQAIVCDPNNASTWNNLGATLKKMGHLEQAYEAFSKAIATSPKFEEANLNLTKTLVGLGQMSDALAILDEMLGQQPRSARILRFRGEVLDKAERPDEAMECFQLALEMDPSDAYVHIGMGSILQQRGELSRAANHLRTALVHRDDLVDTHSGLLFLLSSDPQVDPHDVFDEHVKWGARFGRVQKRFSYGDRAHDGARPLRIGYVSPDFRKHAVTSYFEPVLREHSRGPHITFCYSETSKEDAKTQVIKSLASKWRSTNGLSDLQVAEMIYEDRIDVLIDLAGHTAGNRLRAFAYKPAPVQITWLGYPNTTGLEAIDYRLTTEMNDPADAETLHVEQLLKLTSVDVMQPPADAPSEVVPPPVMDNGWLTFGSFHRYQKISNETLDLWADVLNAVPDSKLLAYNTSFTEEIKQRMVGHLVDRGVWSDRITIQSETDRPNYHFLYHQVDIGLDVFPWNGGTTTREALWMGVAVIGLKGATRSARGTSAALESAGLNQLVANSTQEYIEIAKRLAQEPAELVDLRKSLRHRMNETLCNAKKFTRELEQTYVDAWQKWASNERH